MWSNHVTSVGTGRNRRLLKDKDGRPAVARSSSRKRKETSKRHDYNALNVIAQSVQSLSCVEGDPENEHLPALPPSRPSTASPLPSPKILGEKIGSPASLYHLAIPPITPAALQPYLEDESQIGEQTLLEEQALFCTSDSHTDPSQNILKGSSSFTDRKFDAIHQSPKTPESILLSRSSASGSTEHPCLQRAFSTCSQPRHGSTQFQSSPTAYPSLPAALPIQRHDFVHSMIDPYYMPYNVGHVQTHEPYKSLQRPQDADSALVWQHQIGPQGLLPPGGKLAPLLEIQSSVVPSKTIGYGYEDMAVEELAFNVRKAASEIEALQVHFRELLNSVDNQAWDIRDMEKRIDYLRRSTQTRFDDERTALAQQGLIERGALRKMIKSFEDIVRGKEESILIENQTLRTQLDTVTQELSRLKEALRTETQDRDSSLGQFCGFPHFQSDEAGIPKYCTPKATRDVNRWRETGQESTTQTAGGRRRDGFAEHSENIQHMPLKLLPRARRVLVGSKKNCQEQDGTRVSDTQHTNSCQDGSTLHLPQLLRARPSSNTRDRTSRKNIEGYKYSALEHNVERSVRELGSLKQSTHSETEDLPTPTNRNKV